MPSAHLKRLIPKLALIYIAGVLISPACAVSPGWIATDQGINWTAIARADFYSHDQGSRVIPLRWVTALKQPNGAPFMADSLSRYGYLANEGSMPPGLPVGFTVASSTNGEVLGMTCAACHTRQITVKGQSYRIDGGPAIVDFQSFLTDLDVAVGSVLKTDTDFDDFARTVIGSSATAEQVAALRKDVSDWYLPYDKIMNLGLPNPAWGPGRLDAVSMIFNRLTGLDLGPPPTFIIEGNIQPANAPVRYPFLWNAARQDTTQWPGFADNGNSLLGLARNVGEVTGVFAVFHPMKDGGRLLGVNYVDDNSTNFNGLDRLEQLIRMIGPPKWRWPTNPTLVARGRTLFAQNCAANCHEVKTGKIRSLNLAEATWATPIQNVGTDTREWSNMDRLVNPGVLTGASIPGLNLPLKNPTAPISVLQLAVVGSIIQHSLPVVVPNDLADQMARAGSAFTPETASLTGAFGFKPTTPARGSYESRVLRGIWAAAPYLHNGSVPTLTELLKPSRERVTAFKIGPAYDLDTVGLAIEQTTFSQVLQTTDCDDLDSGNSRCGHEFGTALSPSQKKALLEYLKTL
jgi:hypothetical protein